ncbi:MAG: PIN domain-containing protein [Ferruginibacter sp.]|nr:PIN domain-containing protein [Ferruginibacter sp.]
MSTNLFIDSDIILDVLMNRQEHYDDSSAIFRLFEDGLVKLYTTPSIIINTQYIAQKILTKEKCKQGIKYLLEYFEILESSKKTIVEAYNSGFTDIEDAIQFYTVKNSGFVNCIITRNTKDYKKIETKIPVLTPTQFLKQFK